jgi:hypothetical protein
LVNIPTTFADFHKQTETTLGILAKFNCAWLPTTLHANLDFAEGGVNLKENWSFTKNNLTVGLLYKHGFGTSLARSTDLVLTHKCPVAKSSLKINGISGKGISGWNLGFMWDLNKQFSLAGSWASGKGGCPVTGKKNVGIDWHPCSHLNTRLTYNFATLGLLANVGKLVHPYLSASLCVESDIHGKSDDCAEAPHRFGAKLTFAH